jgi:hypothetical protein
MGNMTFMRRIAREAPLIPLASKVGFLVIVVGLAADVIAHLGATGGHDHGSSAGAELSAHLVVFLGMVLVLIGVVIDGLRSGRRALPDKN